MVQLTRIRRTRAVDTVCEALRNAILDRKFSPGQQLDVKSLAEAFDTSLTPVRQAIETLATLGYVEIKPRSGTFVTQLTAAELEETFDIRRALECLAAENAVKNVKPSVLERMKEVIEMMGTAPKNGAEARFHNECNYEFHELLVKLSGNRMLIKMYGDLHAHIKIAQVHCLGLDWTSRLREERPEHLEIFRALERRDEQSLKKALQNHIERGKNVLIKSIRSTQKR